MNAGTKMAVTKEQAAGDIEMARRYVRSQRGEWTALSARTGLGYHWIVSFGRGKFSTPGHDKIVALLADEKVTRRKR